LEACCFGLPVFFGNKNYQKFQEAIDLLEKGGAFKVANAQEFLSIMNSEKFNISEASKQALDYVNQNLGATNEIMKHIAPLIQKMKVS
jgi:3-deoxy-D-manno-octulosonic-acid transferase